MKPRPSPSLLPVLPVLLAATLLPALPARSTELEFAGHTWTVRSGRGGPGPNAWDTRNVWLDGQTNLHLKIACRDGQWSCAEVTMKGRLGFGRYEFQTVGRLDRLDDNVVLGLFNYPTRDVGPDATHEIDIEFARWGRATNPIGNFTVWPAEPGLKQVSHGFPLELPGDDSTHRFVWTCEGITFQSLAGLPGDGSRNAPVAVWNYRPSEPQRFISQEPMPVHLNLWLFQGRPPKDGQEVELVIRDFRFTPVSGTGSVPPPPAAPQ
ncbi:MAG: glycoside hydrolase family 16 protein [Verrucomicrobiae bacterium]|nr:glycoside hydrolase family 16 protein [Verrucomicrobiae bacterium]MCP5523453.1 glycoside hydrolase family 16 protein [Verrucomicrobiales bacterium]